jgi:hypothetical protein
LLPAVAAGFAGTAGAAETAEGAELGAGAELLAGDELAADDELVLGPESVETDPEAGASLGADASLLEPQPESSARHIGAMKP